ARVILRVPTYGPHVTRPRGPRRIVFGCLEADQHRVALTRKDAGVVALHAPEVRQVEDVVGRAHDERIEVALGHQRADALELRVVALPAHVQVASPHGRTRGSGGVPSPSCQEMTGLRSTPIFSISASITSPGLR